MVQLYAWATIRESYTIDNEDENLNYIENKIRLLTNNFKWINSRGLGIFNLCYLNGELTLNVSIKANRQRQETNDIFDLFKYIAKIAKGSYGLIYFHDDEDLFGMENAFHVFILARGVLKETKDEFLSPLIPIIED